MSKPLDGLRVLDLTRLLPGPFATLLLADMGAEVVKVEDPTGGDYIRWMPPYYGGESERASGTASAYFLGLNRNKKSIRLDLRNQSGREVFLNLVESYDVVVEGFRPGVMDKLGVGYEVLKKRHPALIYCAITGYGQDGPLKDRAGHDTNYLALAGLLGLTGRRGGPPIQAAGQIADLGGGGLMAAIAILAALHGRDRTGQGEAIDISMTDGSLSWMSMIVARYFCEQQVPHRGDPELAGGILCYLPYETKDGRWVSLGALEPKFWQAWCDGIGREDLKEKQFEHPTSPAGEEVAGIFRERTRDEWQAFAAEHDCCLEPVLGLEEAIDSELFAAREMIGQLDQPGIGVVRQVASPIKFGSGADSAADPAPALGQHTEELLADAGYDDQAIAELRKEGAI